MNGSHRTLRVRGVVALASVVLVAASAFLLLPSLASVPARLAAGCGRWLALAVVFELLSALGFVLVFKLGFGDGMGWGVCSRIALWVLGASTVLPAGGLLGPVLGAWATRARDRRTATRAIAFVLLTNAPNVAALALLGVAMYAGWIPGGRAAILTILPAGAALAVLGAVASLPVWLRSSRLVAPVREAEALIRRRDWKLVGAFAYYAFDNSVLWAAFRAFGHAPSLGVIGMAYLIGSIGGAVPLPAGLGGVEAGLLGTLLVYGAAAAPAAAAVLVYRGISLSVPVVLGTAAYLRARPAIGAGPGQPVSTIVRSTS